MDLRNILRNSLIEQDEERIKLNIGDGHGAELSAIGVEEQLIMSFVLGVNSK